MIMRMSQRNEELRTVGRLGEARLTRPKRRHYVNAPGAVWPPQSSYWSVSPAARPKSDLEAIFRLSRCGRHPPPPSFDRKSASRRSGGVLGAGARWRIRKGFLSSDHFEASPMLAERMDAAIAAIVGGGQVHWSSTIRVRLSPTRSGLHGEHPPCSKSGLRIDRRFSN